MLNLKKQNKNIRIISISKYAHTEPLFKNLKLLKVEDIPKLNELKFYYKFENELLPNYFKKTQEQNAKIETEQKHFTLKQK